MRKVFLLLLMSLIVVFCLLTTPLVSMANVRVEVTSGTGPGSACPFYARIERQTGAIHTDELAAIPFYRDPECVPEDFNLLDFFDAPAAFDCESYMAGFEVWKNPMPIDLAPIQSELKAVGPMPIYFVPWSVLEVAMGDDALTMDELKNLDGIRIGIATFYTETLHPSRGASQQVISIVAHGCMVKDSNVRFELKFTGTHDNNHVHAKIEFKTAKAAPSLRPQSNIATTWGAMKGKY